jgi:Fe-S-cluster containining protein
MNDMVIARTQYIRFYQQFRCLGCGKCCTMNEGGILLQDGDIERLGNKLGISKRKFKDTYTIVGEDQKRRIKYPCPFHTKERGCTVYGYRTKMCHDYPVVGYDAGIHKLLVDSKCSGVQKMIADSLAKGGKHGDSSKDSSSGELHAVPPVDAGEPPRPT